MALTAVALASPDAPDRRPAPTPARNASDTGPDGLLVLAVLTPERAMVADPRTGATSERRLPGGTFCHGPLLAVGDRVVVSGTQGRRPTARSLPLAMRGRGRSLGPAATFTASRTEGRVWLGHWRQPQVWSDTDRARGSFREVDATGRPVAHTTLRVHTWGSLEAVLDDGFLFADGSGLSLRSPGTAPRRFRRAWLVAAGGSRFAWCQSGCRRLRIWSRDAERTLDPPAGVRLSPGRPAAFSPAGDRLAAPVRTRDRDRDRVAIIDLASGAWRLVPGRLAGYRAVAWSPSGRWLYFTGPRDRVLAWSGGRPVRLPIDTGGAVMSIATTDASAR